MSAACCAFIAKKRSLVHREYASHRRPAMGEVVRFAPDRGGAHPYCRRMVRLWRRHRALRAAAPVGSTTMGSSDPVYENTYGAFLRRGTMRRISASALRRYAGSSNDIRRVGALVSGWKTTPVGRHDAGRRGKMQSASLAARASTLTSHDRPVCR